MISGDLLKETDIKKLGKHLATVREFKGLSRKQAALDAGVSLAWLQKLETGKHMEGIPKPFMLEAYCESLGIALELRYKYTLGKEGNSMDNIEKLVLKELSELDEELQESLLDWYFEPNSNTVYFVGAGMAYEGNDNFAKKVCQTENKEIL